MRVTIHLIIQQLAAVQAGTLLRLPVQHDAVADSAQHDRTAIGDQGDRSTAVQSELRPCRNRTRIMYRHSTGRQGDILRRWIQALIGLALERHREAPESPPTEDFAEIDLVDDPGVIGAVRLVAEHHAARALEPSADGVDVGIRPDPALRRPKHRFINREVAFRQHQYAGTARNGDLAHALLRAGNGRILRYHNAIVLRAYPVPQKIWMRNDHLRQ